MGHRHDLGAAAEELVVRALRARGVSVIGRNIRGRGWELDVVARTPRQLIIVEVRMRGRIEDYQELLPYAKRIALRRGALWAQQHFASRTLDSVRLDLALVQYASSILKLARYWHDVGWY